MSSWTKEQNKLFEDALDRYDEGTPNRWQKIARAVGGGKTAEEVERHYEMLIKDLKSIESENDNSSSNAKGDNTAYKA